MADVSLSASDEALAQTQAGDDVPKREQTERGLPPGSSIGRYVVLDRLGAGAMGVVHAAYDPQLDRKVALKVLREWQKGERARARLLREAQALARLSHPNVITIYDVGTHADRVFLAMELVEGETLEQWAQRAPRRWRDVLDVFVRAGRGLAAAHAAGLVHRDFKPANVMIGRDPDASGRAQRVQVMDFGLARSTSPSSSAAPDVSESTSHPRVPPSEPLGELTLDGAVLGTPSYMAPEQYAHGGDTLSDQFSFCVALYEALYGRRPFEADTAAAIAFEIAAGRIRPPVPSRRVPAWVHRIVVKGLSPDPLGRHASMAELVAALERDPGRRRRVLAAGVAATLLVSSAAIAWQSSSSSRRCDSEGESALVWNDARRESVRAGLTAAGVGFGEETWSRVETGIDAWTAAWIDGHRTVCESLEPGLRGEDPRMQCFSDRARYLDAILQTFADADPGVVEHAITLVADLPAIAECSDGERLHRSVPRPDDPRMAASVAEVRAEIPALSVLLHAARHDDALVSAEALSSRAEAIGWAPLVAELQYALAVALEGLGRYEPALEAALRAHDRAVAGGHDVVIADAAILIGRLEGVRLSHADRGAAWLVQARPWADRLGDTERLVRLHDTAGDVHRVASDFADAKREHEAALALLEAEGKESSLDAIATIAAIAQAYGDLGESPRALKLLERAIELSRRELGPGHPKVAALLSERASTLMSMGDLSAAAAQGREALDLLQAALGPEHPTVAVATNRLANAFAAHQDHARAMELWARALEGMRVAYGPESPRVADILDNMGLGKRGLGLEEEAEPLHRQALGIRERTLGADHLEVGHTLHNLGLTLRDLDRLDEARTAQERALTIFEARLGRTHPKTAYPLTELAQTWLRLDDPERALALLEEALRIRESNRVDPAELARTLLMLADARWRAGADRVQARGLAERALALWIEGGEGYEGSVTWAQTWLDEHPLGPRR